MNFSPPLIHGTLIKRYKRFLADIRLDSGEIITAHCPNTGSMLSCSASGSPVCLSTSDNPKRKYPNTLEMIHNGTSWIGVNTARTNTLVAEAILENRITEFKDVVDIKAEVTVAKGSRLDLKVTTAQEITFIEIKNCSLAENGIAMFPDAVTTRGAKHLRELISLREQGVNACIFFLVQRMDASSFSPAAHIDSEYAAMLFKAKQAGVMALAYQAEVSPLGIEVIRALPVIVPGT